MTKDIKQIQNENRRMILNVLNKNYSENEPLTLNKVLLSIGLCKYYDDIWFHDENPKILMISIDGVSFDLTLNTLEEQSEETQRGINEHLTDIGQLYRLSLIDKGEL